MVEEFGLIDKIFAITLDNPSSNANAMDTLTCSLVTSVLILHLYLLNLISISIVLCINIMHVISLPYCQIRTEEVETNYGRF